ncbi:unnamed protein product [Adineta ricciae]|uniref:Uncharacterized protein n=1 Tax=Adineta ricciae TaxID=249248 RepID=A0A815B1W5_ADIRI|nr:unnamed protein product [Adineta ricciae]
MMTLRVLVQSKRDKMIQRNICCCFALLVLNVLAVITLPQTCHNLAQYDKCSSNPLCACLHSVSSNDSGICAFRWTTCSELDACTINTHLCFQPNHICVHHPDCQSQPLCYPLSMTTVDLCPSISETTTPTSSSSTETDEVEICLTATWFTQGITVAGGKGFGDKLDQLADPYGIFLDDNDTIYIADRSNHRIVMWEQNAIMGQWLAGYKEDNARSMPLNMPQDLVVDQNGTMHISDGGNYRVVRWNRGAQEGEVIVDHIQAVGIAQDNTESIYVSEYADGRITKWSKDNDGQLVGQVIATKLRQSNFIFVDRDRSVYSTGYMAHRIVKIIEGVEEPLVVAGQSDKSGHDLHQLTFPTGVFVDHQGTIYVADTDNHRIVRWPKGATSGILIVGEHGRGSASDQLAHPSDLFLDRQGNLYVTDTLNNRVQKFLIDKSSCGSKLK